jgi:hypothetical protein
MKNNEFTKYTPEEILQIIIDFYNFQSEFCLEIAREQKLTFQTPIKEWRNTCELLEPNKIAKTYHEFFGLETDQSNLIDIILREENTLKVFCFYLAQNATKEKVNPILSLATECLEAAIFKTLKDKLEKKGIDTNNLNPSTKFAPFFYKHSSEVVEIVSKLAPGTLSYYKIKDNLVYKLRVILYLFSAIILIFVLINQMSIYTILISMGIPIFLLFICNKYKQTYDIGGFDTIRDLIIGIKIKIESAN